MKTVSRRRFLQIGGIGVAALGARAFPAWGPHARRGVVVFGGGWGGATAAKYLRLHDANLDVTLLEPNKEFISCPFSNLVLAGVENLKTLTMNYNGLRKYAVKIRH